MAEAIFTVSVDLPTPPYHWQWQWFFTPLRFSLLCCDCPPVVPWLDLTVTRTSASSMVSSASKASSTSFLIALGKVGLRWKVQELPWLACHVILFLNESKGNDIPAKSGIFYFLSMFKIASLLINQRAYQESLLHLRQGKQGTYPRGWSSLGIEVLNTALTFDSWRRFTKKLVAIRVFAWWPDVGNKV